jgi:hypothetical protein
MSVTDQWQADPSWPPEQQLLFRRLKDRFAVQLGLREEQPGAEPSAVEEKAILDRIEADKKNDPLDASS